MAKDSGFTLIEILTVIVILGVLAGLAVPVYVGQVEKARGSEALEHLNASRSSMIRYYSEKSTYVGATMPANGSVGTIDYNPNASVGGQIGFFTYDIGTPTKDAFQIKASRKDEVIKGVIPPIGGPGVNNITIDEAGVLGKNGVYQ